MCYHVLLFLIGLKLKLFEYDDIYILYIINGTKLGIGTYLCCIGYLKYL